MQNTHTTRLIFIFSGTFFILSFWCNLPFIVCKSVQKWCKALLISMHCHVHKRVWELIFKQYNLVLKYANGDDLLSYSVCFLLFIFLGTWFFLYLVMPVESNWYNWCLSFIILGKSMQNDAKPSLHIMFCCQCTAIYTSLCENSFRVDTIWSWNMRQETTFCLVACICFYLVF